MRTFTPVVCLCEGVKLVAHRGASAVAPENTMSAFRLAIDAGADAIEFDVQATADGPFIVLHDSTLDRTTDGMGAVFATDWATVAEVDAGSWFSSVFAGEHVPLLEEVLALPDVELELELKGYGAGFLDAVIHAVHAASSTTWSGRQARRGRTWLTRMPEISLRASANVCTASASRSTPTTPLRPTTCNEPCERAPIVCPPTTWPSPAASSDMHREGHALGRCRWAMPSWNTRSNEVGRRQGWSRR